MKVIVDNKIPFIKEAIGKIADEVIYVPGKDFTPALVKDADALIIRTRTQCNRELLQGSRVQFIATATIGFDHIDTPVVFHALLAAGTLFRQVVGVPCARGAQGAVAQE